MTCFFYSSGANASDVNDLRYNVFFSFRRMGRLSLNSYHLAKTAFESTPCGHDPVKLKKLKMFMTLSRTKQSRLREEP